MSEKGENAARMDRTLSITVNARLRTADTVIDSVPTRFLYRPEEPLDVRFEFGDEDNGVCSWLIGRDQLLEGLLSSFSAATFTVQEIEIPAKPGSRKERTLHLALWGKRLSVLFEMDAGPIRAWLAETYLSVKAGSEGSAIDWDGFLARLGDEPG